jgi:hypothetical protein
MFLSSRSPRQARVRSPTARRRRPPYTRCPESCGDLSQALRLLHTVTHLGGIFPTSVAARKSITAWSHFSMEHRSETCRCRHLPAFQPVNFPTAFQSSLCWSLHWLQWRKRCSCVGVTIPSHRLQLSSSRRPNHYRLTQVGACAHCNWLNLVAIDLTLVIGTGLLFPVFPLSL